MTDSVWFYDESHVITPDLARHIRDACGDGREACICDFGPCAEGPEEDCPRHGRPYSYWVGRSDALGERERSLRAGVEAWLASAHASLPVDYGAFAHETARRLNDLRALLDQRGEGEK